MVDAIMPTYEYACEACGHAWEAEQSIKEAALTDCPGCGAARAKRQISAGAGFILKGGGWTASSTNTRSATASGLAPGSTAGATGGAGAPSESAFQERFAKVSSGKPSGD